MTAAERTVEWVRSLTPAQVATLSPERVAALGTTAGDLTRAQIEAMSPVQVHAIDWRAVSDRLERDHGTLYAMALKGRHEGFGNPLWRSRRPVSRIVNRTTDARGRLTGVGWHIFTRFVGTGESVYTNELPSREAAEARLAEIKANGDARQYAPEPRSARAKRGVWMPWSWRGGRTKYSRVAPVARVPGPGAGAMKAAHVVEQAMLAHILTHRMFAADELRRQVAENLKDALPGLDDPLDQLGPLLWLIGFTNNPPRRHCTA